MPVSKLFLTLAWYLTERKTCPIGSLSPSKMSSDECYGWTTVSLPLNWGTKTQRLLSAGLK